MSRKINKEETYDIQYMRNYRNHYDTFVFLQIPDDSAKLESKVLAVLTNH